MDTKLKNEIEDIFTGKATVEQAQKSLSHITENDLKKLFPQVKLTQLLNEYKRRNNFTPPPLPHISQKERELIWQKIISEPAPFYNRIFECLKEKLTGFFASFLDVPFIKYGLAATIVILVALPTIFLFSRYQSYNYIGPKGKNGRLQASLEFAIVGPKGKLSRPDQTITEENPLAFRVSAQAKGFCSLFVIYEDQVDKGIADKFLSKGIHDLKVGYTLTGNRGLNTLVMLFADAPISIEKKEKQKLIFGLVHNNVSSITIRKNVISITYQKIEIK